MGFRICTIYQVLFTTGNDQTASTDGVTLPEPERSPLARLVLFIICLAAVAALAAGIHYLAIDQFQQKTVPAAPENTAVYRECPYPYGYYWFAWVEVKCEKECCQSKSELVYVLDGYSGA